MSRHIELWERLPSFLVMCRSKWYVYEIAQQQRDVDSSTDIHSSKQCHDDLYYNRM